MAISDGELGGPPFPSSRFCCSGFSCVSLVRDGLGCPGTEPAVASLEVPDLPVLEGSAGALPECAAVTFLPVKKTTIPSASVALLMTQLVFYLRLEPGKNAG